MAQDNDSTTASEQTPRRRAPRRATRGVVTTTEQAAAEAVAQAIAAADAKAAAADPTATGATAAPADEAPAKAPRKRAPRRATSAPDASPAEAPAESSAAESSAAEATAADEAPARKPARSRKKAATAEVADAPSVETADAPTTDAPVEAAPRKRRATRATKTADAADAQEIAPATQEVEPPAEPAPKATRSRARKPKAAVETPSEVPVVETPAAEVASSQESEPVAKAEPTEKAALTVNAAATEKPKRRRATRQAAAPEPVAPVEVPVAETPVAAPVVDPAPVSEPAADEAPAKAPRRRRAVRTEAITPDPVNPFSAPRAATTPERDPEQRIDVLAAFGLGAAVAPAPAPAEEDVEELEDEETIDETEAAQADAPRLPATALLFQPPAPARRRRRATSQDAETAAPDEAAPTAADEQPSEAEEQPRSRRRGRGRGRGRAENAAAHEGEETPEEEPVGTDSEDAENVAVEADDATTGDDASADDAGEGGGRRRRRRGGRGRKRTGGEGEGDDESRSDDERPAADADERGEGTESDTDDAEGDEGGSSRRRRRRRGRRGESDAPAARPRDEVTALKGSTRLEAKRLRRREGRDAGRRRQVITEAEFLARRESVERSMVVRERGEMTQIAVTEDGVLVEHYVARAKQTSMVGNVYLGRVQNVLPSMEAAFVDLGKGRNAVLYAGEVNWEAAGLEGQPRRIEQALKSGDQILVQVTKDPIGHKGARLTSQITLAGRYLVLVPSGAMTGISRKLPENERARLKKLLKEIVPAGQGVIVRTAAEGASEEELRRDVERLTTEWADITARTTGKKVSAPALLKGEPELALRVVRDVFNEDFSSLTVAGAGAWETISSYVTSVAPDLAERLHHWTGVEDVFASKRIDEQLAKGMDRKVWLPSGGSLVIDRTEAMTVVDVNTGKFTGSGGTLEETVTRNNLEAAEEIVRQLRLRDIGGIIVVDFIDMVLESNRDLVLRRLIECLGRDRTRHQVAEVTSLGLVQMTRKRVGQGLVEAFSTTCEHCHGRGFTVNAQPHEHEAPAEPVEDDDAPRGGRRRGRRGSSSGSTTSGTAAAAPTPSVEVDPAAREAVKATLAQIAAAAQHAHDVHDTAEAGSGETTDDVAGEDVQAEGAATGSSDPEVATTDTEDEAPVTDVDAEAPADEAPADEASDETAEESTQA